MRSRSVFRYRALAEEIEAKIHDGTYAPGEKLPSIRQLHRRLNLSISTIHQAYIALETIGLVEARPKSGYFVSPVSLKNLETPVLPAPAAKPLRVETTGMVNSVLKAISDPRMLPLGSSTTATDLLPHRQFARIFKTLSERDIRKILSYSLTEGHPGLRRQLALRMIGFLKGVSPEDIVITTGCMEAVTLCLQAILKPGDTLAIETPTHFGFLQLFKEMGIMVVEVPTHPRAGVDIDALARILESTPIRACLFMPNIHNPLGTLLSDEGKERLVNLLNRHDVPVIEDDICGELYFEGQRRPSLLKTWDRKNLVLTCSSFSKTLAPGFRIGWVLPGPRFKDKILRLKAGSTVCTATPDQEIMARFLEGGAYERHLRILRGAVRNQTLKTAMAVKKHFPQDTRLSFPAGGSLLWIELNRRIDGMTLYQQALENRIAILPGAVCSVSGMFRNFIRIGCGAPFTNETERGIETLGRLARQCLRE
ncbi:PLP-dependent aminotransferase family protein [Desulfococcus sp.]|uniref:aminotransferase-like domain-containing protein n=1 Tax=Desulfococcus sp. TaxID=2025834 RepID=UPI00042919F3|nr:transcriptional regulator, GntR family with aminotransferase domain [Desulfococcus multivorans]